MNFRQFLARFDYAFPKELIAHKPAAPRDSARLLVYERSRRRTHFDIVRHLPRYLPEKAVLVMNQTKVIPARLVLTKETGGRVRILYLGQEGRRLKVMADRKLTLDQNLALTKKISFRVSGQEEKYYFLTPSFAVARLSSVLQQYGQTPLPPYIKSSLKEAALRERYQAVFAKAAGSVAAPTASLHFTPRLLAHLRAQGHAVKMVTLHVNLGTFAPLELHQLQAGKLHREWYEISPVTAAFLNRAKKKGRPIIAVGTTVVRTLESAADRQGRLRRLKGETDLFIQPGYRLRFVDMLITNFHVPRSSLLMLVSAFIKREMLLELYRRAIEAKFRLFSFGDTMFVR